MSPELITSIGGFGMLSSGAGILAQATNLPILPEGFQSWPVTAMLAFIALASMYLCWKVFSANIAQASKAADAAMKQAEGLVTISITLHETNNRLNEVCQKQNQTNTELAGTRVQLENRPCIMKPKEQHDRH